MATDSNCAVSWSAWSTRADLQPSRVARTACKRSSEFGTGVLSARLKRRLIEHPDQCDRQIDLSQMIQNPSAIVQRAVEF
jgi:hypothetical protein